MAVGRKYKGVGGPWRVEWPLTLVPCADDCANIGRLSRAATVRFMTSFVGIEPPTT